MIFDLYKMNLKGTSTIINEKAKSLLFTLCFLFYLADFWAIDATNATVDYNVDSLYKELNAENDTTVFLTRIKLFEFHLDNDLEKALIQLEEAKSFNFVFAQPQLKVKQAEYYHRIGHYEKAEIALHEAMVLYKKQKNTDGVVACLNELGINASEQGDYKKALELYLEEIKLLKSSDNILGEYAAIRNIAGLFAIQGENNEAEKYLRKAIQLISGLEYKPQMMRAYNLLANIQSRKGDIDSAFINFNRAKHIAIEEKNQFELTTIYHNIGTHFDRISQIDSAIFYWEKALKGYQELQSTNDEAMILYNIAYGKAKMGDISQALTYGKEGINIAKKINNQRTVMQGHALLMELQRMDNNYEKALHHSLIYYHLKDSLEGEQVKNKINELNIVYETEKKENLNLQLAKESEIKNLKISRLLYMITGLVVFVLLIIFISIFYFKNRKVKELKTKIELEQKALRAQMNPHFIFNCLNNIHLMYVEGGENKVSEYLADFSRLLRIVLDNSGETKVSLSDELDTLKLYLEMENIRADGLINYSIEVDPHIDQLETLVPPLILQPFIENAIWHGILPKNKKGKIEVHIIRIDEELIKCVIVDDGIGIEKSKQSKNMQTHYSKGMQISEERLGKESKVTAEELDTGGTKITILIPVNR